MIGKCESSSCGKCGGCWCKVAIRVLLAAVFIYAGYGKVTNIAGTAGYIAGVMGVSAGTATFFAWASGLVELVAGLFIVVGYFKRYAALALVLFTLVATYFFHLKGALAGGADAGMQWVNVLKNLAIIGGLSMLGGCHHGACGSGSCGGSCDGGSCGKCEGDKCEHGEEKK